MVLENNEEYIIESKKNIVELINKHKWEQAFILLLIVLERLDTNDSKEFINYFINHKFIFC